MPESGYTSPPGSDFTIAPSGDHDSGGGVPTKESGRRNWYSAEEVGELLDLHEKALAEVDDLREALRTIARGETGTWKTATDALKRNQARLLAIKTERDALRELLDGACRAIAEHRCPE